MGCLSLTEEYLGVKIKFSEFMRKYLVFVKKNDGSGNSEMHSFPTPEEAKGFIESQKAAETQEKLNWWQK